MADARSFGCTLANKIAAREQTPASAHRPSQLELALVAAAYYWTKVSRTVLFWAASILTRPLGAVVGDFLDKPLKSGGLALGRHSASFALVAFSAACVVIFPQKAASQSH